MEALLTFAVHFPLTSGVTRKYIKSHAARGGRYEQTQVVFLTRDALEPPGNILKSRNNTDSLI